MPTTSQLTAAQAGDHLAFDAVVTPYLKSLKAHCYRMAGSWHEAEDLLQESLVRAWRGLSTFEGRSSLKTWLYTVTTRTCLDVLEKGRARTLPEALGPPRSGAQPPGAPDFELPWLEPSPLDPEDEAASPEARLTRRESVGFAFLTVIQKLPPRQRAILLLRDVLGWPASDCAQLLELSVPAVNSALQRARQTLVGLAPEPAKLDDAAERRLLSRYVGAWEAAEVGALLELLVEDATLSMPPLPGWYRGREPIGQQLREMAMPEESAGQRRCATLRANGLPAVAVWKRDPATGIFTAEALHVLELTAAGQIRAMTAFLNAELFPSFGLGLTTG